jgi:hypothetical protein
MTRKKINADKDSIVWQCVMCDSPTNQHLGVVKDYVIGWDCVACGQAYEFKYGGD